MWRLLKNTSTAVESVRACDYSRDGVCLGGVTSESAWVALAFEEDPAIEHSSHERHDERRFYWSP